jgi:uncharacterized membrane-anchored protein
MHRRTNSWLVKVPEVTVYFWIIKVLTTAMGEATSDYFVHRVGLQNTTALAMVGVVTGVILAISLVLQLRKTRYVAWTYWLAVVMVAVFGTMAADGVHVQLGVPYVVSSAAFSIVLAVIFALWYARERTLSIHSITTFRRECFYWAVVMATFALGTAVGDMTALAFHLGYLASGFLFTVLIAIPLVGYWRFGWNEVFAFWFAYVLTRPLGASYADWFAFPKNAGGLGIGHGVVAIGLSVVIVALVAYVAVTGRDTPREQVAERAALGSGDAPVTRPW